MMNAIFIFVIKIFLFFIERSCVVVAIYLDLYQVTSRSPSSLHVEHSVATL